MSDPEAEVARVEALGRRVDTPCGAGTMAWRVWGGPESGECPPVVLAHGGQGAWSHWIRTIEALATSRKVIAVDLPGHGDSALPDSPDHGAISRALAEGLHLIVGDESPVDLVGFSFGGVAFAHFAAYFPERARRLVIVGCGGLDTPHGHVDLRRVGGLQGEERRAALKANLLGLMLHGADSVDALAMHLLVANGRKAKLKEVAELVLPDKLARILPEVRAQVDAIWGEFDRPHPDPAVQLEVIRRSHPDAEMRVIAGAGHWAMYERADAFNAAILDMLATPLRAEG